MIKIYFLLISLLPFLFPTLADSSNCTIPNCITCSLDPSNLTCLQCDTGFYYDREQEICAYLFPCNEGEYKNETTGLCFQCSPDCESCIGPGSYECSTCPKGYYLVLMGGFLKCYTCSGQFCDGCDEVGNCISCPVGYWLDNTLGNCKPCNVANCRNCDSDLNGCDQCSFGFLYSNLTQTCNVNSNCQLGYYNNYLQSWACSACDHSCFNCFGGDKGSCYECASGYFFNNNSQCEQCNASCSSCDEDASYCVSCNSPLMLRGHECVTACAGDEYYDQFEMRCKSCDPSCGSCKYSATYCLDCADQVTQKLVNNTCVSICGPQKYAYLNLYHLENYLYQQYEQFIFDNDTVISQQGNGTNCQNCRSSCANCIFDSYYCTQCAPGMYLQLSNAQCSTSCPTGTYSRLDNSSNVSYCLDCPYPCASCSNYTFCIKCASPFVLNADGVCYYDQTRMGICEDYQFTIGSFCLDECPEGTEAIGQSCYCDNSCNDCMYNYQSNFLITCIDCVNETFYSYNGICMETCPNGTWIIAVPQNGGSLRILQGGYSKQKYCYDTCPSGYLKNFVNGTRICTTTCPQGSKAISGFCTVDSCPNGTFFNPLNNSGNYNSTQNYSQNDFTDMFCSACDASCLQCNGPTTFNCLSCPQGTYLQGENNMTEVDIQNLFSSIGEGNAQIIQNYMDYFSSFGAFCNASCPNGQIILSQMCVICFNNCTSCAPPLVQFQNNCLLSCPYYTNYSEDTNECTYDPSNLGNYLELNLTNPFEDDFHVSYLLDVGLELQIQNYADNTNQPPLNISSLNCSLENYNNPNQSVSLFIQNFNFAFVNYAFSVPSSILQPANDYSVYCQVTLSNPPITINQSVDFETFPQPQGNFDIYPVSGVSLADNFTVRYWNWQVLEPDNITVFLDIYLNYEIWLTYNGNQICIFQSFYQWDPVDVNQSFYFPYVNSTTNAQIILSVYNDYTSQIASANLTILPQANVTSVNYSSMIDFQSINPQNLNILLNGYVQEYSNISQQTLANLQSNNEFLYQNINNDFYYTCYPATDCHGNGNCYELITDPKNKCYCFWGYAGFDCSWTTSELQTTTDLFANTLNYLQNQTDNNTDFSGSYQILNDVIGNLAQFPDAFNNSMLQQAVGLIQWAGEGTSQNDTIRTIQNLGQLMNVLKILKSNLTTSDFENSTNLIKNAVDYSIASVSFSLTQTGTPTLSIVTDNLVVKLQSLAFLGGQPNSNMTGNNNSNNSGTPPARFLQTPIDNSSILINPPTNVFTILLNDSDSNNPQTSPGVDVILGPASFAFLNYYADQFYASLIMWSSAVLAPIDSNSRYFTQILSFDIKNLTDYSDFQFFNDSNFTLRIPKIINVSSMATSPEEASDLFTCLYYDNNSLNWSAWGMNFSNEGMSYLECTSNHLTDFSVQLVENNVLLYDYFHTTCEDCYIGVTPIDPPPGPKLGIMSGVYLFISLLLVWMVCAMFRKNYNTVTNTGVGGIKIIQPLQLAVRAGNEDGEKGGVIVVDSSALDNAKGNPYQSANVSAKTSQVFDFYSKSGTLDSSPQNKKLQKPISVWSFHPIYSIFIQEHSVPVYRKLMQLHFTMSTTLWLEAIFCNASALAIPIVLLITWAANYIFGFILTKLIKGRKTFSMCGKIFGVFLYFVILFIMILLLSASSDVRMILIYSLGCYLCDWIFFDSVVVAYISCYGEGARKWFRIRGFSE